MRLQRKRRRTDLIEHVVRRHAELIGVEHQAFGEQREQAVAQHDLSFPPDWHIFNDKRSVSKKMKFAQITYVRKITRCILKNK